MFDIWPDNFYIYATKKINLENRNTKHFSSIIFSGKPYGIFA